MKQQTASKKKTTKTRIHSISRSKFILLVAWSLSLLISGLSRESSTISKIHISFKKKIRGKTNKQIPSMMLPENLFQSFQIWMMVLQSTKGREKWSPTCTMYYNQNDYESYHNRWYRYHWNFLISNHHHGWQGNENEGKLNEIFNKNNKKKINNVFQQR